MPVSKSAQERYIIYDECFSNFSHFYSKKELMNLIKEKTSDGISDRTFWSDIEAMKAMVSKKKVGVGIETINSGKRNECYYRYTDNNFHLYGNALNKKEFNELKSTIEILERFHGVPGFSWIEETIPLLESKFGINPDTDKVVEFYKNEDYTGLQWLSDIIEATINHKTLIIAYTPFKKEQKRKKFYPYYVKQYNNRWFVFGREHGEERITSYALDRIDMFSTTSDKFEPNNLVYFPDLFKDIIGVTLPDKDMELETITLRFSEKRFPYVETKPIHRSQEIINNNEFTISIKVKPTKELDQKILSFGPDVTVLSPEWYREHIHQKIEETVNNYKK